MHVYTLIDKTSLSVKPLQSPDAIADALRLVDIIRFWDRLAPKKEDKKTLLQGFNAMVKRRNQIAHEGDRLSSRKSGKKLRIVTREELQGYVDFAKDLVARVEATFPR